MSSSGHALRARGTTRRAVPAGGAIVCFPSSCRECATRLSICYDSGFQALRGRARNKLFAQHLTGSTSENLRLARSSSPRRSRLVVRGSACKSAACGRTFPQPDQVRAFFLVRHLASLCVLSRRVEKVLATSGGSMSPSYVLGLVFALIIVVTVFMTMRNSGLKNATAWWYVIAFFTLICRFSPASYGGPHALHTGSLSRLRTSVSSSQASRSSSCPCASPLTCRVRMEETCLAG